MTPKLKEEYRVHPAGMATCNKCGAEFFADADRVGHHTCKPTPDNKGKKIEDELLDMTINEEFKQTDYYKHPLELSDDSRKSLEVDNTWDRKFDEEFEDYYIEKKRIKDFIHSTREEAYKQGIDHGTKFQADMDKCVLNEAIEETAKEIQAETKKEIENYIIKQKSDGGAEFDEGFEYAKEDIINFLNSNK